MFITHSEFVFSFTCPACNAHAPYYHLWPGWLYSIFPHYLKKARLKKKQDIIEHQMYVACNISHSKNN